MFEDHLSQEKKDELKTLKLKQVRIWLGLWTFAGLIGATISTLKSIGADISAH